jgi:hypothetical protein
VNLVQQRIVRELRAAPVANMSELRKILGLSATSVATEVQALRYQGKILWNTLELSPSMSAGDEPAPGSTIAPIVEEEGGVAEPRTEVEAPPPSGPDDHDDYPGEVNDAGSQSPGRHHNAHGHDGGFIPKKLLHKAGVTAAATRAAARPLPVPEHEPEIARLVREEVEEIRTRRRSALSTATVSTPLELKKFGVPDLTFAEGMQSLLAENPNDLMAAISRKHAATWRRVILLGRALGQRPAQTLYACLEAGLAELEQSAPPPEQEAA